MQWQDNAYIICTKKYGENAAIVTALTEQNGLWKGMVRGASGKRLRGIYQPGNFVQLSWKARLNEHLGNFTAEIINANSAVFMYDAKKLTALNSICSLLEIIMAERDPANEIFEHFDNFIKHLKNDSNWLAYNIILEIDLLGYMGFALDLSECAATGKQENLTHVSPNSGKAVCYEAALPYIDKLLILPEFLLDTTAPINDNDIMNGLKLSEFFLNKYFFKLNNKEMPDARKRLLSIAS